MSAQILPIPSFKASTQPVAHFIRIGDTGHLLLADMHAEGRLPTRQIVVDASRLRYQRELVEPSARRARKLYSTRRRPNSQPRLGLADGRVVHLGQQAGMAGHLGQSTSRSALHPT